MADYRKYLFEYRFKDSEWGLELIAASPEEARERLKAISWAKYKGEIAANIPVSPKGIIKRLFGR